jgi:hypothetical protein
LLLAVIALVAFWDRRPPQHVEAPRVSVIEEQPAAAKLTVEEMSQAVAQCARKSSMEFRKAWDQGTVDTEAWSESAGFASHYNEKQDVCFYMLTIVRQANDTAVLVRKLLYDVNEGELYGEYRGPEAGGLPGAGMPNTCRMAGLYCASSREWDRLAGTFMESGAVGP